MRKWLFHSFKSVLQRLVFTFEQFSRLELANHAAAGAYAFLLSAMPALLIILYISSRLFVALDLDLATANQFLEPYLGAMGAAEVSQAFLAKPVAGIAGILGLLNLLWASRLFVVSIQRGLRVIYLDAARPTKLRENILTFVVELTLLFSVILIIAGSQLVQALVALLEWQAARLLLGRLVVAGITYLPLLIVWLFIFLTYLSMPKHKMRKRTAFLAATLCVIFYWLLSGLLSHFLSTVRYGVLYGILGNLVSSLLKVFAFFWLYFFFAQFTYTLEFFDTLLFSRFRKLAGS
ncbi:MAG: YihY/virulence factor BrkB family protein, partial [Spirochaetes bacterium]|nr:YihY/virulence factor BrkB family protein [Spirochaetota bacterium]MBU0954941.1 YihY/virulence factor BrkB family protein [Spirochaetota bacterium]